jgi:flagellum-specific peptidoglycan hydrolase FlgJ
MAKKKGSKLGGNLSYTDIAALPMGTRQSLMGSSGLADMIRSSLTAGQMASMFPTYYKDNLNAYAGQKSQFTAGGGATSGYSPSGGGVRPASGATPAPPGAPPSATPVPKTGLTPSEFRRIESNPLLAGYGDQLGRQGDAKMGSGNVTLAGQREKPTDSSAYYDRMYKSLYKAAVDRGVPNPEVIARLGATQTSLETGYGQHMVGNNAFGIKANQGGGTSASTQEFVNGRMVTMNQNFRTYASPEDSAGDYIAFLQGNKRYAALFSAQSVEEAIAIQGTTGYASDPDYGSKLASIHGRLGVNAPTASVDTSNVATNSTSTATPVNDKPTQGSGQLAAVETKGMTSGQNEALKAAEQGAVPTGTGTEHYAGLRQGSGTKIGKDDPIWNSVDPALKANMNMLLDRDTGLLNRDTLLAADAQAKVLRAKGYEPNPVSGGDNHSENHGAGRDANYAIDMGASIKDPKTGKVTPVNVGTDLPYELKRDMAMAASLSGDGSGQNLRIGFPTNQSGSAMHTQFDSGKESALWGYDRRTAAGTDPTRAILETTPDGQRFLSDMASLDKMKPADKSQLLASLTGSATGTQVAAQTSAGQQTRTDADNLLALADSGGKPPSTAPANTAPQTVTVDNNQKSNAQPVQTQTAQSLASVEQPTATAVPTSAMASGGIISEPHTAVNDRTGEITKLGEKGTGGEAVIPMNKVNAAELGQQPYQMQQPQAAPIVQNQIIQQQVAATQSKPEVTPEYSNDSHPEQGATLGKAYARARMSNYTPSNDYVSFGHPVV